MSVEAKGGMQGVFELAASAVGAIGRPKDALAHDWVRYLCVLNGSLAMQQYVTQFLEKMRFPTPSGEKKVASFSESGVVDWRESRPVSSLPRYLPSPSSPSSLPSPSSPTDPPGHLLLSGSPDVMNGKYVGWMRTALFLHIASGMTAQLGSSLA